MTPLFEVLEPGILTTVQDLGRVGWQRQGVGTAGAMDRFALEVGNLLVGNPRGEAALEIGLGGLRLRCLKDWIVAVTGADLGAGLPLWKSVRVRKGEELFFKSSVRGVWAYVSIAGGLAAEKVMGSKSTCLRGKIGRPVGKGDILGAGVPDPSSREGRGLATGEIPEYSASATVRVVLGPEEERFPEESMRTFLSSPFEVTAQSNRMGYRLRGPALRHKGAADILSDAVATGTIQVPADGQPIVLLADRQTTGGYSKIATVISADLPALAQTRPGAKVSFRSIAIEEAQQLAIEREKLLSTLEEAVV